MAGAHIARLQASIAGMDPDDVGTSRMHWDETARSLRTISGVLDRAEASILEGFGPGSAVAAAASTAFSTMRSNVLEPREAEMQEARAALDVVQVAMTRARATSAQLPTSGPGAAPTFGAGTGDEADDITRMKLHATRMRAHQQQVAAYAEADERARQELVALNRDYDEAAEVMARIHGEPVDQSGAGGPGGPGGSGGSAGGSGGPRTGAGTAGVLPAGGGQGGTIDSTFPTGGGAAITSPTSATSGSSDVPGAAGTSGTGEAPQGTPIADTGASEGPGSAGSSGLHPLAGGAAAGAGALGGLGAKGLIGRLGSASPAAPGGTPVRPVGASGRAASSGVLGGTARPGSTGATGTPGASGSAGAGRAGTAGTAGAAGAAGAAGRRGGGRTDGRQPSRENDLEVEEDWLDDEGHSGVLG